MPALNSNACSSLPNPEDSDVAMIISEQNLDCNLNTQELDVNGAEDRPLRSEPDTVAASFSIVGSPQLTPTSEEVDNPASSNKRSAQMSFDEETDQNHTDDEKRKKKRSK